MMIMTDSCKKDIEYGVNYTQLPLTETSDSLFDTNDENLTRRFVLMILSYGTASIVAIIQVQHNVQIIQLTFGFLFLTFGSASAVGVIRCVLMDRNNVQLAHKSVISLNEDRVEWK